MSDTIRKSRTSRSSAGDAGRKPATQRPNAIAIVLLGVIAIALVANIGVGLRLIDRGEADRTSLQFTNVAWPLDAAAPGADKPDADAVKARILRILKEYHVQAEEWESTLESLLTNETGKRLASDPQLVDQFIAIYEQPRVDAGLLEEIRNQLDGLLPDKKPLQNPADSPETAAAATARLRQFERQTDVLFHELRSRREELASLLRGNAVEPSARTLQRAVAQTKREQAQERVRALVEARETERRKLIEFEAAKSREDAKLERLKRSAHTNRCLRY